MLGSLVSFDQPAIPRLREWDFRLKEHSLTIKRRGFNSIPPQSKFRISIIPPSRGRRFRGYDRDSDAVILSRQRVVMLLSNQELYKFEKLSIYNLFKFF